MDINQQPQPNPMKNAAVVWGLAALVLAILATVFNTSPMVLSASLFMKIIAILVGAVIGTAGALIGEALRVYSAPDAFFTSGGMGSILKTKLFWAVGPQLIGLIFGILLGISLVLS